MNATLRAICLLPLFVANFHSLHAASTNSFRLTVELQDGSRVVGKSSDKFFEFHSETLGELKLPLEKISSIECQHKTNAAQLITANGDKLEVAFAMMQIHIETSFGSVKLPVDSIRKLQVSAAGMSGRTKMGLVALWSGEGNANDSVGGCNGQLVNSVGFAPGKVGQAFDLNEGFNGGFGQDSGGYSDGSGFQGGRFNHNGGYILIPTSATLDVGNGDGFTIECWIKPAIVENYIAIFEYERELGTSSGSDVGIEFGIHKTTSDLGGIGSLYVNIVDVNGSSHILDSPSNLLMPGIWQFITLSYDKISGTAAIYLNGAKISQSNLGGFTPQTSFSNLLVGARTTFGSASNPVSAFSGGLDEIGVYNRALSASEIQAIGTDENNGQPLTPPSALDARIRSGNSGLQ